MMTGDKFETAESVAVACKLVDPYSTVFRLKTIREVDRVTDDVAGLKPRESCSMVVEGSVLEHLLAQTPEWFL